jgi:hypothetical protein
MRDRGKDSSFDRRRRAKLAFGVLAVALLACTAMGTILLFMGRMNPHF